MECAGVGLVVGFNQPVDGQVRVFLCGRQAGMAQHLLDGAQISPTFQQVGGEGMADGMRRMTA